MTLILQDSSLVFWQVVISDIGQLSTTVVSAGPVTPAILYDTSNLSLWKMQVATNGLLTTVSVGSGASVPYITLQSSPSNLLWNLQINPGSGGLLIAVREAFTGLGFYGPTEEHHFFSGDIQ
jgi:hypothetical protein